MLNNSGCKKIPCTWQGSAIHNGDFIVADGMATDFIAGRTFLLQRSQISIIGRKRIQRIMDIGRLIAFFL